jgi:hypothetical protein
LIQRIQWPSAAGAAREATDSRGSREKQYTAQTAKTTAAMPMLG